MGSVVAEPQPPLAHRSVVEFKMLGAVEVVDDGGQVSLGGPQQRRVLAVLLSDPGTTLTYDRLLEVLWPDGQTPDNARRTAISYVSRLRSALGNGWVKTSAAGYQLDISSASVDALRFVALVERGRDLSPERAIDVLDEALALWRGPVFGDLHGEWWALPAVSRLDELHLAASADRIDALSAGGWDARALSEVQALVAAHPLRGPFVERLMRGLQASGRTDEALRAFQQHRNELIERTGLDPSDELIALDRSIAASGQLSIPADAVGRTLRGYVLRDVIGEGSFGTVYRATQPHVARDVAIKVVKRELADDRTFIHRFEAEARMVARLEHPHIVPLYDFWREPGGAYLVFRLLRGGTAEQVMVGTGPFDLARVTRLLEQIGGALGSAHAAGVIHRDVKPANILFDDEGEAYLTDFGIATAAVANDASPGASPPSYGRRSAGSPMYASPEQARDGSADARADQYALAATIWELLTGQPPFEGATAAEVIKAKLESPLAPVRLLRPDVPARVEEVLTRASAVHPADRYPTVAEFVNSWRTALSVSLTTTTSPPGAPIDGLSRAGLGATALTMSGLVVNPFKGLRPFGEEDAADFFGRDQLVHELHHLVTEQRFTAVVGPSGSGKSSLVLAGLVPELKRGGFLVGRFTPGADPFDALFAALIDLATVDQAPDLSPDLLRRSGGLVAAVDALAAEDGLVIVIDQLEELWTTTRDDERALFAESLVELHRSSACARVVATVRADWFDRPLRDPSLGPLVARATFGITPMHGAELHSAISDPAARVGVRFESGLVGRMVTEALDQPGSLPLLQFALAELFDRRSGATITTEVYDQIGGLSGSVAHQAELLYANFTPPDQSAVRRLFSRLVTAGDGAEDTRRTARQSELIGVDDQVVNALVDRRLLTVDRDRESREPTIEIAHEALLRGWPRLREWLDEDRDWVRELRALASATRLWESSGRDEADLYRGARLAVTSELVVDRTDSLTPDEAAFLDASARLVDAERIAAEERTRTRERQNRRLRRSLVGLGVVTILALIAGLIAVAQSNRADEQAAEAQTQAALAAEQSVDADTQRAVADEQRSAAEDAADQATAAEADTAFVNLANTSILERGNRQDLAALLAIEAYRIDPERSRSALFSTFTRNVGFLGYRHLDGANSVLGIAPLADGTDALAAFDGGRLVRFDIASGSILQTLDPVEPVDPVDPVDPGEDVVNDATFLRLSGDGRVAVLAVQDGETLTWRAYAVSSGQPLAPPVTVPFARDPAAPVVPLRFEGFGDASVNTDGSLLAIGGGAEGQVLVFDTADGSTIGTALLPPPNGWPIPAHTASVQFDDDDTLYVGVPSGEVMSMDPHAIADGELSVLTTLVAPAWSTEYGLRFGESADGRYLITFGSGAVSRIDLQTGATTWTNRSGSENLVLGASTGQPTDLLAPCRDVVVAADADNLYCADDFGSVAEQSVSTGVRTQRSFDRQSGVTGPLALTVDHSELLASSLTDDSIAVWKLDGSGPIQRVIASEGGSIATWGYNTSGTHLTATSTNLLDPAIWDPVTGQMTDPLDGIFVGTWAAAPDRHWSAFSDGTGGLYDTTTRERIPGEPIDFEGLAWPPYPWDDAAHQRMYHAWGDHIKVFDQLGNKTGPTIQVPATTGNGITTVHATPDGTKLVISQWGGTSLYDLATGTRLDVEPQPFMMSIVSPNGVAVGSTTDGRLYVFDPNTLEILDELPGLHGYAELMRLSADGTLFAASNESSGISIYDVPSRTELGDGIADVDGSVNYFSLRPDGKELAVPYGAPGIVLWDLDPQHWLDAACALAGRNLTQDEWDQYLSAFGEYHESCDGGHANP